ncbi:MAG: iron-sulfur cluster assembly protein, partial [Nitriliruptorales bacterium]|nr:iron-sulfur cluster assembly protein [Nitriliruptorales bacterium]
MPTQEQVLAALATVNDPEINKPITELGMVDEVVIEGATVGVRIKLTVPGCPLKDRITEDVTNATMTVEGVENVQVAFGSMTNEERADLTTRLRGEKGAANPAMNIPFAESDSPTQVVAVASGKG